MLQVWGYAQTVFWVHVTTCHRTGEPLLVCSSESGKSAGYRGNLKGRECRGIAYFGMIRRAFPPMTRSVAPIRSISSRITFRRSPSTSFVRGSTYTRANSIQARLLVCLNRLQKCIRPCPKGCGLPHNCSLGLRGVPYSGTL
jgi:hypothetical protein